MNNNSYKHKAVDIYIARQPIFDTKQHVVAFELLYRQNHSNFFPGTDGSHATLSVINSLISIGPESITSSKKAYINFTQDLLNEKVATLFSKDTIVIEILENVKIDRDLIRVCRFLKQRGYTLALDDFVFEEKYIPLLELVNIIKVDFLRTPIEERHRLVKEFGCDGRIKFLAEKVETLEDYQQAIQFGYSLFQGYFFSKPVIIAAKDISTGILSSMQMMLELNKTEPSFEALETIIKRDLGLTYKLLKLVNSPIFRSKQTITSLKHAIARLGLKEVKKWLSMVVVQNLADGKPNEIMRLSLIRAKFAESVAFTSRRPDLAPEFFMMGLFSMIDVLLNTKLEQVVDSLPLSDSVKGGLKGDQGLYGDALKFILFYEKAEWEKLNVLGNKYQIKEEIIPLTYLDSVTWANEVFYS